jgi:hypothetical protein
MPNAGVAWIPYPYPYRRFASAMTCAACGSTGCERILSMAIRRIARSSLLVLPAPQIDEFAREVLVLGEGLVQLRFDLAQTLLDDLQIGAQ